jgi:nucleoside phosphorylase
VSAQLVICAPLRLEYAAVRRGVPHSAAQLIRIGMGQAKACRDHPGLDGTGPVAILGVAGGLAPQLVVPDVVVASRVVTTDGFERDCPHGPGLAERLSAAGLRAHLGTVLSVPKIVEGPERSELAKKYDALACDMESGYLAERLAPDRPFVVVRALSDSVTQPLFSPRILKQGAAALRAVRQAAEVVRTWHEESNGATPGP